MNIKNVAIIVLTWNNYTYTAACIRSLLNLDYPSVQVIVVDNGSTDDTTDKLCEEFSSRINVIRNEHNVGYASGNNIGIRYALNGSADYIMLLNNDTTVNPTFLMPLVERLIREPRVGVVTPKILFMHRPDTIWAVGGKINKWLGTAGSRGRGEFDTGQYDMPEQVDYTTGCCFLTARSVFERAGLFEDRYFAYYEDVDWSLRVRDQGLTIWYEPASEILHVAGASSAQPTKANDGTRSPYKVYLLVRNNLWFIRTHIHGLHRLTAISTYVFKFCFGYTLYYTLRRRWTKLSKLWSGLKDGFAIQLRD